MSSIAREEADAALVDLFARAEGGKTIVVTRAGNPVLDLVPRRRKGGGLDLEAGEAFLRAKGIVRTPGFISGDFDDPLPEDFLIWPLLGP